MDIKVDSETVVVFDLDDTLYNELDFLKSAYKAIAKSLEPNMWEKLYSRMFSLYRSGINVFEFLSHNYNREIQEFVNMYRHHNPDIKLFDGVMEIFQAIKSKNGKIAVITDGRSTTQRVKLNSLGILEYIDSIIISEEFGSEKPALANFKAIEHSLPGKVYYYIADNLKKDFIAPNKLGWKSIALIDNGMNIHNESYLYMEEKFLPQMFLREYKHLNII
ncbi:HAD family hydrolase [Gelidibacter gilvus]|uniref:HAD family hydrolase n=1 Tax=Gelidibacter gilvus TaxID=59602 RepID=A0A4Q0XGP1_9FLAO|nr:HAD family hydrolase [Gelidibacter gilvus]RXJ45959.1 HAD family hydrolase [Gelidibacter gilvus]